MAALHLALVATGSLIAAALFAALAWQLGRRPVPSELRAPAMGFTIAWAAFSFEALNDALRLTVGVWLLPDTAAYFALAQLKIIAASIAIWGLAVYVVYLWRGTVRGWNIAIMTFAATHALVFLYLFARRDAIDVTVGTWAPRLVFANDAALPGPLGALAVAYFFLPPIVLGVVYLLLLVRLTGATQRYRVTAVAVALILFHVTNASQSNPDLSGDSPVWAAIIVLNIGAGLLAYSAYRPPVLLRDHLGIQDIMQESAMGRDPHGSG